MKPLILGVLLLLFTLDGLADTTVLYQDHVVELDSVLPDPNDLWVRPKDLTRVNGFELKPEGACLDDLCVPVRQDEDSSLFVIREDKGWFNVTELARKLQQAYVYDHGASVWSLSAIPVTRNGFTSQHIAPDFTLADRQGNLVTLSAFRSRKVLLITWASW